ncbi:hypothetical protein [Bradyrhizobium sp. 5.13L]
MLRKACERQASRCTQEAHAGRQYRRHRRAGNAHDHPAPPRQEKRHHRDMYREMSRAIDTARSNADIRHMIVAGGSALVAADIEDFMCADTRVHDKAS